jgi:phage N-6-adenine-methyltransferase
MDDRPTARRRGEGERMNEIVPIEESPEAVLAEVRMASEAFGAAREGAHISAYAQARVIRGVTWLLAEGRWALAGLANAGALVDAIRLESYRLSPVEREAIEQAVKAADASISNRRIAKMLGVDEKTVRNDSAPAAENASENNGETTASADNSASGPSGPPHLTRGTGDNEWWTPVEHVERARRVLGEIDVDPASDIRAQERVRAAQFFTKSDDGLKREWHGRVWLNPPYAQPAIEQFIDKLVKELAAGRTTSAILLTDNSTDTAWGQKAALAASLTCFTRGRIRFESPTKETNSPLQGQAFFYFGGDGDRFAREFADIGVIYPRAKPPPAQS